MPQIAAETLSGAQKAYPVEQMSSGVCVGLPVVLIRWDGEEHLLAFSWLGPSGSQQAAIIEADVKRYDIASVGGP